MSGAIKIIQHSIHRLLSVVIIACACISANAQAEILPDIIRISIPLDKNNDYEINHHNNT